tara:strand:+ start:705 stop:887 length:183 start_codon:yes stop_codon:yes gene_type:complete
MGILSGLFNLAEDIISIPTDLVGITNHHDKKEMLAEAKRRFIADEITSAQYEKLKIIINT